MKFKKQYVANANLREKPVLNFPLPANVANDLNWMMYTLPEYTEVKSPYGLEKKNVKNSQNRYSHSIFSLLLTNTD